MHQTFYKLAMPATAFIVIISLSYTLLAQEAEPTQPAAAKTRFLIIGKGKLADPQALQQRAIDAIDKISQAARIAQSEAVVDSLAEKVMTVQQFRSGTVQEIVTGNVFRDRLQQLIATASPQDTVVIYTHSHGCRNGFETTQPWGGLVLDLPVKRLAHNGTWLWDEYAELLLQIPAKNVIVLTMSCFSGGFVDALNSPPLRDRWSDRHRREGRNFVVLTSQNASRTSDPILKGSDMINPFTYAVAQGLAGEADGFALTSGRPSEVPIKDGKLTIGEMIDYILYTTENTVSDRALPANAAFAGDQKAANLQAGSQGLKAKRRC